MNKELQQQLMEFVYGLLEDDEANALCERITSDPDVARAYSKVKLQCDLVGRAARVDAPNVAWIRPEGAEAEDFMPRTASSSTSAQTSRGWANWCIGIAASVLLCLAGSTYLLDARPPRNESTPVAMVTATPTRVVLTGPSKLNAEADNPFTVQVESEVGTPVSTTLDYRVYDAAGSVRWEATTATDTNGVARFDVDGEFVEDGSRLEIAPGDGSPNPIVRELQTTPDRFVTYLRTDRPLYEPGESVFFRSVTLSEFGLTAEREVTTSFDIVDANDSPIEGAAKVVETERGVGSGAVTLPTELPDGKYTLLARSPDNAFREEWRDFHVRRFEAPRLLKKLELAQDSYTAGEQVDLDFSVERVAGEPLADVQLQVEATLDGVALATDHAKTDAAGKSLISLTLPDSVERGQANVRVSVRDGDTPAETISKDIPINLGKVNIDFYPEGGELAAELPSRVYFYGRDPVGKPTHIEGRVVDSAGKRLADVTTIHDGRGVFALTPASNETYRLLIDKPVGVTKEVLLPVASTDRFVSLDTGEGVFDSGSPISYSLSQRRSAKPLIVAAYCRDAMVGQETVDPRAYEEANGEIATYRGQIAVSDEAQGVIRLTVFDSTLTPPRPVAERLVYRRVGRKLSVELAPDAESFTPGQSVQLELSIRDELDAPVSAALGIAIVDDAVLNLADDKSTRMPTYFHLLSELDSSEQLEDANFYLSDEPDSAAALDSLLGTQGWRRFTEVPATQFAQTGGGGFGGGTQGLAYGNSQARGRYQFLTWSDEVAVPLTSASKFEVRMTSLPRAARSMRSANASSGTFASPVVIGSIMLLLIVAVASVRWKKIHRSVRIYAVATALTSLLIGTLSLPLVTSRSARTVSDAAPASGAVALQRGDPAVAYDSYVEFSDDIQGADAEAFMYGGEDVAAEQAPSDLPMAGTRLESTRSLQPNDAPAARYGVSEAKSAAGLTDAAMSGEEDLEEALRKQKKADMPAKDSVPRPSAESSPPASNAVADSQRMLGEPAKTAADKEEGLALQREYAHWFFDAGDAATLPERSASTIFWLPLFVADDKGKATVYFDLPKRPSSFRAIVEAHGADRLGAGELLINSQ